MTIQLVCTPRALPEHLRMAAAERAIAHNPANRPSRPSLRMHWDPIRRARALPYLSASAGTPTA
jgi:hypothetical protein